jgi:aminocarboxymuconate-semialdehyde decarboxylase
MLAPLKIIGETSFSDGERAAINGRLAQRLFGL